MEIIFLLVLSILCGLGIGVIFTRLVHTAHKHSSAQAQSEVGKNITEELKKTQQNEQLLREEVQLLQGKLRQAFEDPVTNLSGWQLFEDRLNRSIRESERFQLPLAILFVDIDDFKVINDALSYEVGDALLREVATRLQACIRQVDSVCRFTKDTYVVLLTQLVKPETAAVVAQRIMQSLMDPFTIKGNELSITVCIGIAIYPNDGKDAAALLRSADHALHLAKEKGHHIYQFYQERLHAQSQRDLILYNSLSRDSIFNEFELYFSPIVDVENNNIICMEVLLHWHHPDLGLIQPNELFLYAAKQRKLNLISEWLLRNACKQFLRWQSLGFKPEYISLPISIRQFEHSHFIYRLSQILQEMHFQPQSLIIQIKEKPTDIPFETLEKAFNMLKYLGVKVMVDNFGEGLFPVCHLKDFPINFLKLSDMVTGDYERNPNTIKLLKALVQFTQSMSMEIIIQGIINEKQKEFFSSLGCKLMQGPYLTQPLTEKEIESTLVSHT